MVGVPLISPVFGFKRQPGRQRAAGNGIRVRRNAARSHQERVIRNTNLATPDAHVSTGWIALAVIVPDLIFQYRLCVRNQREVL